MQESSIAERSSLATKNDEGAATYVTFANTAEQVCKLIGCANMHLIFVFFLIFFSTIIRIYFPRTGASNNSSSYCSTIKNCNFTRRACTTHATSYAMVQGQHIFIYGSLFYHSSAYDCIGVHGLPDCFSRSIFFF